MKRILLSLIIMLTAASMHAQSDYVMLYLKDGTTLKMLLVDMQLYKDKSIFLKIVLVITNIGFLTCSTSGIPLMFYSLKKNLFDSIKYYKRKWTLGEKSSKKAR